MAEKFERLSFTKDWNNSTDFPTYEENEAHVRADMQLLHDEVKAFINEKLIPGIENLAVPGTGDMLTEVFDPEGMMQDIFAYARSQAAASVREAGTNTSKAIQDYDVLQTNKFSAVGVRQQAIEQSLINAVGRITLHKEFRSAGTFTVDLPADTVLVYALAVGAGGGGARGGNSDVAGAGGCGGNAVFIGPIMRENITNLTAVVGKGGSGGYAGGQSGSSIGTDGGASSVFGFAASGGAGGGKGTSTSTDLNKVGAQVIQYAGETLGGSGGAGAGTGTVGATTYATASAPGSVSHTLVPINLTTVSAGGGGGGSSNSYGATGGVCSLGSGGTGGYEGNNGSKGGQCCGGGGGSASMRNKVGDGGAGGDGYVAIWIQRAAAES